jgi:ABC-2 type transport system ATP-binding protein
MNAGIKESAADGIAIEVRGLTKRFGSITAVDNLCLDIRRGEVFGFLGPNGAGKTTAINMICGLLRPDAGRVVIHPSTDGSKEAAGDPRRTIGLCPQAICVWESLTCLEQLEFMGRMYDVGRREARARGLALLETLGLAEKKNKLAKTLSGGMQRRLNIILALVHEPAILILDEPQAGLDPQSRVLVREFIRNVARLKTVILTTHEMDEAERLSERVAIIDRGRLLICDTPENLKGRIGEGEVLEITFAEGQGAQLEAALPELRSNADNVQVKGEVVSFVCRDAAAVFPAVAGLLKGKDLRVVDFKIRQKTLEDVFIHYTGRGLRE